MYRRVSVQRRVSRTHALQILQRLLLRFRRLSPRYRRARLAVLRAPLPGERRGLPVGVPAVEERLGPLVEGPVGTERWLRGLKRTEKSVSDNTGEERQKVRGQVVMREDSPKCWRVRSLDTGQARNIGAMAAGAAWVARGQPLSRTRRDAIRKDSR